MKKKKERKSTPGPKPDTLKIDEENWEDALKTAIQKKKPKEGWPDKPNRNLSCLNRIFPCRSCS